MLGTLWGLGSAGCSVGTEVRLSQGRTKEMRKKPAWLFFGGGKQSHSILTAMTSVYHSRYHGPRVDFHIAVCNADLGTVHRHLDGLTSG